MKKLLPILLLVCLAVPLFGVGKQETKAEKLTLNVLVRNYTLDQDPPYKTAKAALEKKFPNVTVNLEGLGYDDTRNKTLITVGANQPLDVVQLDYIWIGEYAEGGVLQKISDKVKASDIPSDTLPQFLESSVWNGEYYAVWVNTDVRTIGWVKEHVAAAGLDPEKAKSLLEEVGWKDEDGDGIREAHGVEGVEDGTPFQFETANLAGEQIRVQLLSLVHAQWKEIGLAAEINLVDVGTMFGDMHPNNNFETSYSYIGRYVDPDFGGLYLDRDKFDNRANYVGFSNERVDELILASQQTADQAERKEYFQEAQALIAEQVPQLFIGWRANSTAVNTRVKGYKPAPGYDEFWNAAEWYIEE